MHAPTLPDVFAAYARIRGKIIRTPLAQSHGVLVRTSGAASVGLKCDHLQRTSSFKDRGAANKIACLSGAERARGVTAASAGNHAAAVGFHAAANGVKARIVMPELAPINKVRRTKALGAEVVLHGESLYDSLIECERLRAVDGMTFVHPFDDPDVVAGQGTMALEIYEQEPNVDVVVVPVGGGGLAAGVGLTIKAMVPHVKVVGVQTSAVPSMIRALEMHKPTLVDSVGTIADGIAVRNVGHLTLQMVEKYVDLVVAVDEEEIAAAILYLLEHEKMLAEGAGAVPVAALLSGKLPPEMVKGKNVVLAVCGGNIDPTRLSNIIERGLAKDSRLVRVRCVTPDHPGALHRLTGLLAAKRANVVSVVHDRSHFHVPLSRVAIEITFEARGEEHAGDILAALKEAGASPEVII